MPKSTNDSVTSFSLLGIRGEKTLHSHEASEQLSFSSYHSLSLSVYSFLVSEISVSAPVSVSISALLLSPFRVVGNSYKLCLSRLHHFYSIKGSTILKWGILCECHHHLKSHSRIKTPVYFLMATPDLFEFFMGPCPGVQPWGGSSRALSTPASDC